MKLYPLPKKLRAELKKPLGRLLTSEEITEPNLRSYLSSSIMAITVGDTTTERLLEMKITPTVQIVDGREMRNVRSLPISAHKTEIRTTNPPGTISEEAVEAISCALRSEKPVRIVVDGEEDLLTLIVLALYPKDSIVLYGQPYEGIVMIKVNDDIRRSAKTFLKKMGLTKI